MNEMVERVARALWNAQSDEDHPGDLWEDAPVHWQQPFRDSARAAIEAMRMPTDVVLRAGKDSDFLVWSLEPGEGLDLVDLEVAWDAMIDEALR